MSFFRTERDKNGRLLSFYLGKLKVMIDQNLADDDEPSVNIDGTSMSGTVDVSGKPYGVTTVHHTPWESR